MTLSGVGGILGCSRFITGTWTFGKMMKNVMHITSSAMISDCSSLLKRLERSPPASTLLMYSRKPWGKGQLSSLVWENDSVKNFNLLFDVLVCEEESGSCACTEIVWPLQIIQNICFTCHPSCAEKILQILQEVGGVVSPASSTN